MKYESVAGVLFSADRTEVLLIQRRDVPVWVLPGGGIEAETGEAAVVREFEEETLLKVEVVRLVGRYLPLNRLAKKTLLYELRALSGEPRISAETRGVRFWPLAHLPGMPPPYAEWIADAQLGVSIPLTRTLSSVTYRALVRHALRHPLLVLRFFLARAGFPLNTGGSYDCTHSSSSSDCTTSPRR